MNDRTMHLSPHQSLRKHLLHREVMRDDTTQHGNMPDVVTCSQVVKTSRKPALGHFTRVDDRADEVDQHALGDGRVEVLRPVEAARRSELPKGEEGRHGERDVEEDAHPGEVFAVEGRVPGEVDAPDAEDGGECHIGPAGGGFAVEGCVFEGHDGGAD